MKAPPKKSRNIFTDIKYFILHKPSILTLVEFSDETDKEDYGQGMGQRTGIDFAQYSVLNIHKIGIEVPVRYVFEELLGWDGNSTCWPNHIATVNRLDGKLEKIQIYLLGIKKFKPLFSLDAIKFQHLPGLSDDNARYLLFDSHGGYPIGFFAIYVRSPIPEQEETEPAQLFFAVGFDFYGKVRGLDIRFINKVWEKIHNRVTANILNRFKQLCEWRFQRLQDGRYSDNSGEGD
jgi:hypothetical protein